MQQIRPLAPLASSTEREQKTAKPKQFMPEKTRYFKSNGKQNHKIYHHPESTSRKKKASNLDQSSKSPTDSIRWRQNSRGSLIVDVDGDEDALGAGLEPLEGGLLVSDDEGDVGGGEARRRQQEEEGQDGEDRRARDRIRHLRRAVPAGGRAARSGEIFGAELVNGEPNCFSLSVCLSF